MDTALVTNDDTQRLAKVFEDPRQLMAGYEAELREMPLGPLKANLAVEYAREAKRYLEAVENSELREHARDLHKAHSFATKILNRLEDPAKSLARYCSGSISDWEIERRRRIEAERRTREEEANRLAAEQRQAEVEHLKQIGRPDEATAKALAPVIPISVSVDPDAGKPEGASTVEVWVPKRDEDGQIVFSNLGAFLTWVAGRPEMHYLVEFKYGKLKKLLTDNRGMVQPPGLEIERKFEPRTRMEQSDE
jgi:hypothetical protein